MISATQGNLSFGSFSRTHSGSEDNHTRATTPEPDENDGVTSAESQGRRGVRGPGVRYR
jgi:hypothetical protein